MRHTTIMEPIISSLEREAEGSSDWVMENTRNNLKFMQSALRGLISDGNYYGPQVFRDGMVVRYEDGKVIFPEEVPEGTIQIEAVNDVFCFIDEGDILDLHILGDIPCEEITLETTNALGWMMALTFFNADGIFMCMNYTPLRFNRDTMERYCETYRHIAARLIESRMETAVKEILRMDES